MPHLLIEIPAYAGMVLWGNGGLLADLVLGFVDNWTGCRYCGKEIPAYAGMVLWGNGGLLADLVLGFVDNWTGCRYRGKEIPAYAGMVLWGNGGLLADLVLGFVDNWTGCRYRDKEILAYAGMSFGGTEIYRRILHCCRPPLLSPPLLSPPSPSPRPIFFQMIVINIVVPLHCRHKPPPLFPFSPYSCYKHCHMFAAQSPNQRIHRQHYCHMLPHCRHKSPPPLCRRCQFAANSPHCRHSETCPKNTHIFQDILLFFIKESAKTAESSLLRQFPSTRECLY